MHRLPLGTWHRPFSISLPARLRSVMAALTFGIVINLVSAGALAGQTVHGRLVDEILGTGIGQAFIVLLDSENAEVNRVITDVSGNFSISAPGPGIYRLRTERIGFRSTVSDLVELGADERRDVVINVRPIVIRLDTIRVEDAAKECQVTGEQGLATATVWEEARKHFAAVAWSETDRQFRYEMRDFERYRERSGEIITETDSLHTATVALSYQSKPVSELQEHGYAFVGDGSYTLYAPDADEFFSEEFLQAHCFSLLRNENHTGLVGLEFEPVGSGEVSDIRGVFWLDEMTSTTRWLEFRYTNLHPRVFEREARGRVEFEQIPNGPWFVNRWWIRAPQASLGLLGGAWIVRGYKEAGGEVLRVTSMNGRLLFDSTADPKEIAMRQLTVSLHGSLLDSESLQPIGGVDVYLDGANLADQTDSAGSFQLSDVYVGSHALAFLKEQYTPRIFRFDVLEPFAGDIDAGIVLLSPGPAPTADIHGIVTDGMTETPIAGVAVSVNGTPTTVTAPDGQFSAPATPLRPGRNLLELRRIGYTRVQVSFWAVEETTSLEVKVSLEQIAIQLDTVVLEAEGPVDGSDRLREFRHRQRVGLGHYFTQQDVEERQPYFITDLLRRVPGVIVSPTSSGVNSVRMGRRGGCSPVVFLDGAKLLNIPMQFQGQLVFASSIDDLVSPNDVGGVEVYKGGASTPAQFGMMGTDCGVIAIWTRR